MSNILCNVLNSSVSLLSRKLCESLSEDDTPKKKCLKLAKALDKNFGNNLQNAFTFLRTAIGDLAICYENLEGIDKPGNPLIDNPTGDQHLIFYTAEGSKLERELREIKSEEKAKDKFEIATKHFRECNAECIKICENESLILRERIFATKARVVTEILGNLEDLTAAAENCMKIIAELHKFQEIRSLFNAVQPMNTTRAKFKMFASKSVQSEETKNIVNISSVININEVVFNFMKKFIRKPVAILDWSVIQEDSLQTYHPIIGQPPIKIDKTIPDLSTPIECNGMEIDPCISAINCKGEVLVSAKVNNSSVIVRIADGVLFPFWSLKVRLQKSKPVLTGAEKPSELEEPGNAGKSPEVPENASVSEEPEKPNKSEEPEKPNESEEPENIQIISISVDCNNCTVPKMPDQFHEDCKNKVYVLGTYTSEEQHVFVLFVIDVQGRLLHNAELTCLSRRNISEKVWGKILCTKDKVIIFDIYRREVYLCDTRGELEKPLNIARQKPSLTLAASTMSDENEIIALEKPNKIHFYNISNDSFLDDHEGPQRFEACNEVKAIAFNHVSNEVTLLCKAGPNSREYHFMRYAKTGELQQDIKLQGDKHDFWKNAYLISHPSGPLVMLDSNRLLNLQ